MNKEETLSRIGLTRQEARAYVALLRLKESQTGGLCKEANIASSNIYKVLDSLIEKGLVNFRTQNNIKIFMPSSPRLLKDLLSKKQKEIREEEREISKIIEEFKLKKSEEDSTYKYFEGMLGIKSMWNEINSLIGNEDIMRVYTGKSISYEKMIGFLNEHHKIRIKKGIKELMIFPKEDVQLAKKREKQFAQIKFMDLKNDAEWGVWKDLFYIHYYPIGRNPKGFLIKDEVFAKTFKQVFDQLWKIAKK
jgi:sugar-specific transcriptional regulator TrmB